MWPLTPAGRQNLALRSRTCCLRQIRQPRPLRYRSFRGSIPHPTRLLCTLRRGRHLPRRNTRYRAGATPYPGRTFTGWTTPASPGAPYHESSRLIAIIAQFLTRSPPGYRQEREDKCDELWPGELNGNRRRRLDSWSYCPWEEAW